MPLIVKGETNIISKEEMKKKIAEIKETDDPLENLSESQKEVRREIQAAKRHREFMQRVADNEAATEELKNVIATSEIVTVANQDTQVHTIDDVQINLPDFESMTKKDIDEWAEENIGITLDRRKTKADMIEELKKHL